MRKPKQDAKLGSSTFRTGKLAFFEWSGLWKNAQDEDVVGRDEYEEVFSELDSFCRKSYKNSPRFIRDFYIRGDYTGDRSQVLEVNDPAILNISFLIGIQKWLSLSGHTNWRVIIPTYLTEKEVIVIYPDAIRISPEYETSPTSGLEIIASRMRKYKEE